MFVGFEVLVSPALQRVNLLTPLGLLRFCYRYKTLRTTPLRRTGTLELMSKPTRSLLSRR